MDNIYEVQSLQLGEKNNSIISGSDICKFVEDIKSAGGIVEGTDVLFKIGLHYGRSFF